MKEPKWISGSNCSSKIEIYDDCLYAVYILTRVRREVDDDSTEIIGAFSTVDKAIDCARTLLSDDCLFYIELHHLNDTIQTRYPIWEIFGTKENPMARII